MILGHDRHPASRCFEELDAAVTALRGRNDVALNAHAFPKLLEPGQIVYNLENVGLQVEHDAFAGHEIWDFSARNVETWRAAGRKATHVPIGYHPSMARFQMRPWEERDIDVVFCGCINERRAKVLDALKAAGLKVVVVGPGREYGAERDAILARSKLALNMLFHEDGTFPTLRLLHAAANYLPMLSEQAPEAPPWLHFACPYDMLVEVTLGALKDRAGLESAANVTHHNLTQHPMILPDPWKVLRDKPWAALRHGLDLEAMYEAKRGQPVSSAPVVCIAVATYRETERVAKAARATRNQVREDLASHGIDSFVLHLDGDSLVCRMRQRACHMFLMSGATHLLFWDADIAARDPDCVRRMIDTGHPLIAGACPFKDMTGRVVHNLWPKDVARILAGETIAMPQSCIEVRDAGTGFMLLERRVLIELQKAHPELLYWSQGTGPDHGAPMWALFDTGVVDGEYRSEDYRFCHLWHAHGGKVHVYVPARFTHYGEHGFEASFLEQYGLEATAT